MTREEPESAQTARSGVGEERLPLGGSGPVSVCALVAPELGALALGALDPAEERLALAHLTACPRCQALAARYAAAVDRLAYAVPDAPPPPQLRSRLLGHMATNGREATPPLAAAKAPSAPPIVPSGTGSSRPVAAPPVRSGRRRSMIPATAGWRVAWFAVAAALTLLLASNVFLWQRVRGQDNSLAALQAGQMEAYGLLGSESAPRALGMVCFPHDGNLGWLLAADLPPLPARHVYQLWLVPAPGPAGSGLARVSGGVFILDVTGHGYLTIRAPAPIARYDRMGITVEPLGGSPAPTGPSVLRGTLGGDGTPDTV